MHDIAAIATVVLALGLVLFGAYRIKRLFARRRKGGKSRALKLSTEKHLAQFRERNAGFFRSPEMQEWLAEIEARGIFESDNGRRAPQPGEFAPDFSLLPLATDEAAPPGHQPRGAGTPIRLSDFRGHQPVVLIFGSYT